MPVLATPQPFFVFSIFEIGSHELFACAGIKQIFLISSA
jgi:hypothetical protein